MTTKTVLVDPDNDYEVIPSSQELVDAYNKSVPENLKITVEDQDDVNLMLLEAGLLEEMSVQ